MSLAVEVAAVRRSAKETKRFAQLIVPACKQTEKYSDINFVNRPVHAIFVWICYCTLQRLMHYH